MSDLYVVDFSGDDDERARREAERDAESRRLADRYSSYLAETAALDEPTARRVIAALFDWRAADGRQCPCGCHPRLSSQHGDGLDCQCGWDSTRRETEAKRRWHALKDNEALAGLRAEFAREDEEIAAWLTRQPDVDARRTTSMAPEQWEGTVDGHSFYFRERGDFWRIELDLAESGRFAQRLARVADDGSVVTEPVSIMEGEVIAEGIGSQLGDTAVEHIDFIVRTIRDHLWCTHCDHTGALFYCPECGQRMGEEL